MPTETDLYRHRERESRELAAQTINPRIKTIHLEIAEAYAQLGGRALIAPSSTIFKAERCDGHPATLLAKRAVVKGQTECSDLGL